MHQLDILTYMFNAIEIIFLHLTVFHTVDPLIRFWIKKWLAFALLLYGTFSPFQVKGP